MKLFNSILSVIVTFCILSSFLSILAIDEEEEATRVAVHRVSVADNEYKDGDEEQPQVLAVRGHGLLVPTPLLDTIFSFFDHPTGHAAHFVCHSWDEALDKRFLEHMFRVGLFRIFNGSHSYDFLLDLVIKTPSKDQFISRLTAFEKTLEKFPDKPTLKAVITMGPAFFVKGWVSYLLGYYLNDSARKNYSLFKKQCLAVAEECDNTITRGSFTLPFLEQAVTFMRGARHPNICKSFQDWLQTHEKHELAPHVKALFPSYQHSDQ